MHLLTTHVVSLLFVRLDSLHRAQPNVQYAAGSVASPSLLKRLLTVFISFINFFFSSFVLKAVICWVPNTGHRENVFTLNVSHVYFLSCKQGSLHFFSAQMYFSPLFIPVVSMLCPSLQLLSSLTRECTTAGHLERKSIM